MVNFTDNMVQAGVVPVSLVTSPATVQFVVRPTMSTDQLKRIDKFHKFHPSHFSSMPSEGAHEFLDLIMRFCYLGPV